MTDKIPPCWDDKECTNSEDWCDYCAEAMVECSRRRQLKVTDKDHEWRVGE